MKIYIENKNMIPKREVNLGNKTRIKTDTKEKPKGVMEKLYFLLLSLELIYEVLRTTPFPGYAETAVANLSGGAYRGAG